MNRLKFEEWAYPVGPLKPENTEPMGSKKCQMKNCHRDAEWMPILEFRACDNCPPAPCALGLPVCTFHKERAVVDDFLSDTGFEQVSEALVRTGNRKPERSLTTLRWSKPGTT